METFQEESHYPFRLQGTFRTIRKAKEMEELDGNERKINKNTDAAVRNICRIGAHTKFVPHSRLRFATSRNESHMF